MSSEQILVVIIALISIIGSLIGVRIGQNGNNIKKP